MSVARLEWQRSDGERVEFPLDGDSFEVGRGAEAAIRIDEPLVSRRHARLEKRGDRWVVFDLGSTNFTRVNGHRIRREYELAHGDELRFARAVCRFFDMSEPRADEPGDRDQGVSAG